MLFDNRQIDVSGSDENAIRQSVDIEQELMRKLQLNISPAWSENGFNFGVAGQCEILTGHCAPSALQVSPGLALVES